MMCKYDYVFFFQAEDGIRDVAVTGVQTCALPISSPVTDDSYLHDNDDRLTTRRFCANRSGRPQSQAQIESAVRSTRSEERRVGKECRCRWSQDHLRNKETKR